MTKPYLVLVNGLLWGRRLTRHGAETLVKELLEQKQLKAVIAYEVVKEKSC